MNTLTDEHALHALLGGIDIPPCPATLLDIDAELRKDDPDQRAVARIICTDVALSGHVMQLVNSPAFGRQNVDSIIQALQVLGNQQVFSLVIGHLLKAALAEGNQVSMERFWDSSAMTARVAAELGRRLRRVRPDVAYTFGLFRDCGIPLLARRFDQTKEVLARANAAEDAAFTAVEEQFLGTNHATIGYFLARRWRLPDSVVEAIRHHHDYHELNAPRRLPDEVCALIGIGALAEHIIRTHQHDTMEHEWAKAAAPVCSHFGLSLGSVDDLIEDLVEWLG